MTGMKKTLIAALLAALLLSIFSIVYADSADDFFVEVVGNCWSKNVSMGGSALYTPYLKLNIKNQQDYSESRVVVKVVFYDESEKSLWSDETDYLVSSGDDPLKSGYSKTAFIRSSVGYRSQISASSLPFVKAEVYINDDYYGFIDINRSYSESVVTGKLQTTDNSSDTSATEFATSDPYGVKVVAAYWAANTGYTGQTLYTPYLKVKVTNQQSFAASDITVKVIFTDDSEKSVWDDETSYLISYSDTPLKTGYNKTAYIRAGVGYKKQISTSYLPDISAEVYVNDEYYGKVIINKSYSETTLNTVLKKSAAAASESSTPVDSDTPYLVTVIGNCWAANQGMYGSSTLYVPYLKLNVLNQSGTPLKRSSLKVVFYNEKEKIVWSDESDYLVSSSDSPVQHGYSKTAFIKSSVGYRSQISVTSLPEITAEVYLDDEYIGTVKINNTYSETRLNDKLTKVEKTQEDASASDTTDPFEVYVTTNCWAANTGTTTLYTPYLKLKVINQQGVPATSIKTQVVFYNDAEKDIWSDETDHLLSSSDTPLKHGYGKVSYVRSSVGYRSQISVSSLPSVTAEIYVNDELYGSVKINNTYNETTISQKMTRVAASTSDTITSHDTDGCDFGIEYLSNCWTSSTGLNGTTLYVPYLKLRVTNQQPSAEDNIVVHVVFTQESDKTVWSDEKDYLISYGDTALRPGYSKTAFIRSSVGYRSQISVSSLPTITASIYINDELYDTVTINREYGN